MKNTTSWHAQILQNQNFSVHKVLLARLFICHLSDCFHVQWQNGLAVTEAIQPAKDQNIYSVAHFRKSALFPGVDEAIFRRRTEAQPKRYRCRKITTMNERAWSVNQMSCGLGFLMKHFVEAGKLKIWGLTKQNSKA